MNSRLNYIIFGIACLSGIAVRTIMLLFIIDTVSGFIYSDYSYPSIGLIAILIIAGAAVFGLSLFQKINRDSTPSVGSAPFYIAAVIMALAIGYETFFSGLLNKSNQLQHILHYTFTIGALAALIIIAVMKYLDRSFHGGLTLLPIAFWIMRLIIIFTDFSTISTISETVIETFAMCLTLVTFVFYAKVENYQIPKKRYTLAFATALLNAYVCAIGSVPRIIASLFALQQPVHMNTIPAFTGLATAIFSAAFAYSMLESIKDN